MSDHATVTLTAMTSALSSLISCGQGNHFDPASVLSAAASTTSGNSGYLRMSTEEDCKLEFFSSGCCSKYDAQKILRISPFYDSNYSSWTVLLVLLGVYLTVAAIGNLVACYKFIAAWNLIVKEVRRDLSFFNNKKSQRTRILTAKEALRTHVSIESMSCRTCCICLAEFEENELVTACDDGCHNWFHRECLFKWLDQSNDCPCCRIDMIAKKPRGVVMDLMEFVGFNPDL